MTRAYNPLSVAELGSNAVRALMAYDTAALPPVPPFDGVGVYTVHYSGGFEPYIDLQPPIYVGKADKGLHRRLTEHATSIEQARNLDLADFACRWLVLEPVWIGLTEQILIERYAPVWNNVVKGFGNHHQGRSRVGQQRSQWDTLHPGRPWADDYRDREESMDALLRRISEHREGNQ